LPFPLKERRGRRGVSESFYTPSRCPGKKVAVRKERWRLVREGGKGGTCPFSDRKGGKGTITWSWSGSTCLTPEEEVLDERDHWAAQSFAKGGWGPPFLRDHKGKKGKGEMTKRGPPFSER